MILFFQKIMSHLWNEDNHLTMLPTTRTKISCYQMRVVCQAGNGRHTIRTVHETVMS